MIEASSAGQSSRRPALEGIRIADFSWVLAGPICTKYLATMGAQVIKIETRRRPDVFRARGVPLDANGQPCLNQGQIFNGVNHSKLSCTLDLTKPKAVEIAKQIVRISDIVIENFAFGVLERMGLGYSVLREINPSLIMVSSSGLGRTGPEREVVAYGNNLHAYSGLTSLVGFEGGPPTGVGITWADPLTGITAAYAILAALYYRRQTGQGQFIDLSMTEATLAPLPEAFLEYTMNGRVSGPVGNRDSIYAPHGCYPCAGHDKWVALAVTDDTQWRALCAAMGQPGLAEDERFSDGYRRWLNQKQLDPFIAEWTRERSHYEAMQTLQAAGVPAGPSVNSEELVNDPHLRERGIYVDIDHPEVGKKVYVGLPWQVEPGTQLSYTPAPQLGQHNDYVFRDLLQFTPEDVERLREELVIY